MLIINLEKFKEECGKFEKSALKGLLDYLAFHRILCELVLVDNIHSCTKDGTLIPKSETLKDYSATIEGERFLIGLLGRKESAKIYGAMEGITSDVQTVDYILANDAIEHYEKLVASS